MVGELDAAWRAVRDVLGAAAKDYSAAAAAIPAHTARDVTEVAARAVDTDASSAPALTTASPDTPRDTTNTATSATYVRGRDLIDEIDYTALQLARSRSSSSHPMFEEIQRLQGFDGPPTITTPHEVDAAIAAGGQELFRGFEKDRYRDDFLTGPVRPGGGPTGAGTYATPLEEVALHYADPTRTQDLATRRARVLRMALHPEARTITLRDLESERTRTLSQIERELGTVRYATNPTPEQTARRIELQAKQLAVADIGRYGALRGWDAIDGSDTFSNKEWVVLNPTALLIQR
ncbi:hypothetical protein [Nocardia paucivorans]|uniref:hypothetical protein n=1 Tax=Nocardia paucivorans TaxID=114259 RepID=UPI000311E07D|nr:hypothetical protein [Nocardia paucivorans]